MTSASLEYLERSAPRAKITAGLDHVDLLVHLHDCESLHDACRYMTEYVAGQIRGAAAAITLCHKDGVCRAECYSDVDRIDHRGDLARALEAVGDETLLRNEVMEFPAPRPEYAAASHKTLLALTGMSHVWSMPLTLGDGRAVGVLIIQLERASSDLSTLRETAWHLAQQVTASVALFQRLERRLLTRCRDRVRQLAKSTKAVAVLLILVGVVVAMFLPVPHNLAAPCELQPVVRRFVAAPYDGKLERNWVKEGDVVRQGQPLGQLDEKEIQWELSGVVAEYNKAAKDRDAALARQDAAASQKARLEMQRLALTRDMLENRQRNLTLESPVSGIVIHSELENAEGAPLEVGQVLYEIAPLAEMILEIAVPESDVRFVHVGMPVTVELAAFPGEVWQAQIERLHPRAELRESDSVFIAEVKISNPDDRLRPGMKGDVSLHGRRRMLGWVLFHKPWNAARTAIGW